MADPAPDQHAEAWTAERTRVERRVGLAILALPFALYPLWVGFDYLLEPALWRWYLLLRVLSLATCAVAVVGEHRATTLWAVRFWAQVGMFCAALPVALLLPLSEHYAAYVLGFSLIVWATGQMLLTSPKQLARLLAISLGSWTFAHLVVPSPHELAAVVGAGFYVFSAGFISFASGVVRYRLSRSEFEARTVLGERNEELRTALQTLKTTKAALEASKGNLEREVAERTAQLSESLLELEKENAERVVAEARAQSANRAKSTFLANMSHELRTPMNAILGYTEMVLEELDELERPDLTSDLGRVTSSARHLLDLIDDVLDITRIEAGKLEVREDVVDVNRMVAEAVELVRSRLGGNQVVVHLDPGVSLVRADAVRLRQVMLNLLSNAAKFTHGGVIEISTTRDGEVVEVRVQDDGVGIGAVDLPRIFERFGQADDAPTRRHGGVGLGLAISNDLVQAMGGTLSVESVLGEGSTFCVGLPSFDEALVRREA